MSGYRKAAESISASITALFANQPCAGSSLFKAPAASDDEEENSAADSLIGGHIESMVGFRVVLLHAISQI